jgi:TRAP-type C4-dicarboxylate transport system permease small subunit
MNEKRENQWKRIGQILLDIPEKYISAFAFTILFLVFVLQIFFRYVLNRPLTWPYEVSIFAFIWTAVLGACFAKRQNSHVVFSLVYDRMSPAGRLVFRLIGNTGILVAFCVALYPTFDFIKFMNIDKSTVLRIPFSIGYGPYLVFMVLIIGRVGYDLFRDVRMLLKGDIQ